MINYKSQALDQIMVKCIGFLNAEQQQKLKNILDIELYNYDIITKENIKELPATVDDFNSEILKKFLIAKAIASLSNETLKMYKMRIEMFLFDIKKKIPDITTDDIRYYLAITKINRKVTDTTLESIRLNLSTFFTWCHNEEYISKNPMRNISSVKKDTIKEEPFSQQDIELLIMACKNSRDRALIEFLLSTGCRVSEAISVNRNQIDFFNKQLSVIGKGRKQRTVYLSDKALVYIKIYLSERADNEEALFISNRKPYRRMTKEGVERMVSTLGEKAGVTNVHPHRFRRTLCNTLIDRGMSLQDTQRIMGHSNPNTTLIYYNNNSDNIQNKFKNLI